MFTLSVSHCSVRDFFVKKNKKVSIFTTLHIYILCFMYSPDTKPKFNWKEIIIFQILENNKICLKKQQKQQISKIVKIKFLQFFPNAIFITNYRFGALQHIYLLIFSCAYEEKKFFCVLQMVPHLRCKTVLRDFGPKIWRVQNSNRAKNCNFQIWGL